MKDIFKEKTSYADRKEIYYRDKSKTNGPSYRVSNGVEELRVDAIINSDMDAFDYSGSDISNHLHHRRIDALGSSAFDTKEAAELRRIDDEFAAADSLSILNAEKRRRVLLALSFAGTLLAISFLLYDEAELYGLIFACGAMLLALFGIDRISGRLECHRKYVEYRVLAESLRLQFYLRYAGMKEKVTDLMPWSVRTELPWITEVLDETMACSNYEPEEVPEGKGSAPYEAPEDKGLAPYEAPEDKGLAPYEALEKIDPASGMGALLYADENCHTERTCSKADLSSSSTQLRSMSSSAQMRPSLTSAQAKTTEASSRTDLPSTSARTDLPSTLSQAKLSSASAGTDLSFTSEQLQSTSSSAHTVTRPISEVWVADQLVYHKRTLAKTEKKDRVNRYIVRAVFAFTIISYIAALAFEIREMTNPLTAPVGASADPAYIYRAILKIVLGTLSAITIFTGSYYGKLSLDNVMDDHRKMIALYTHAQSEIAAHGETPEIVRELAREFLNENSTWYAYQSKNKPEISI